MPQPGPAPRAECCECCSTTTPLHRRRRPDEPTPFASAIVSSWFVTECAVRCHGCATQDPWHLGEWLTGENLPVASLLQRRRPCPAAWESYFLTRRACMSVPISASRSLEFCSPQSCSTSPLMLAGPSSSACSCSLKRKTGTDNSNRRPQRRPESSFATSPGRLETATSNC